MAPTIMMHHAHLVADTIRVVIVLVGFLLAMLGLRFAYIAWRKDEAFRVAGIVSFACIVATPSVSALFRFDNPINWWSTGLYLVGLMLGFVAVWANYFIAPPWWRLGKSRKERAKPSTDHHDEHAAGG